MAIEKEKILGAVEHLCKLTHNKALSISEIATILHVNSKSIRRHFDHGLQGELTPLPYVKNDPRLYERHNVHKFVIFLALADILQYTHAKAIDFLKNCDLSLAWSELQKSIVDLDNYFFRLKNGPDRSEIYAVVDDNRNDDNSMIGSVAAQSGGRNVN